MYELRYIINLKGPMNYEVLGSYPNYPIAHSQKKIKHANYPGAYVWEKMQIVKV